MTVSWVLFFVGIVGAAGWIRLIKAENEIEDDGILLAEADSLLEKLQKELEEARKPKTVAIQRETLPCQKIGTSFVVPMDRDITDEEVEIILKHAWEQLGGVGIKYLDVKAMDDPYTHFRNVYVSLKVCGTVSQGEKWSR